MITVNLDKAKEIAHEKRRLAREELFKPLDVRATIPMYAETAEIERQQIREEFAEMQAAIDKATCVNALKEAIEKCV